MFKNQRLKKRIKSLEKSGKSIENDLKDLDKLIAVLMTKLTPELKESSDVQQYIQTIQEIRNKFIEDLSKDNETVDTLKMIRDKNLSIENNSLNTEESYIDAIKRQEHRMQLFQNYDQAYQNAKPKLDAIF